MPSLFSKPIDRSSLSTVKVVCLRIEELASELSCMITMIFTQALKKILIAQYVSESRKEFQMTA